jgi:nitroreductase
MSQTIRAKDDPGATAAAELIRSRRSINLFDAEAIGDRVLLDAIELARWAPNHRLTEPWKFYLLGAEGKSTVARCWSQFEAETKGEKVGAARRARLEAIPGHFVVTSQRSENEVLELENYAACCCALQNLMLYLWQRGVGVKWTTGDITREPRLYDALEIDAASERIVGYFWYGIPKVVPEQKRRDVADIVVQIP